MKRIMALLALTALLAGCSTSKKAADFSCPRAGFVEDADVVTAPDFRAEINGFKGVCTPNGPHAVALDLTLPFVAKKSPAAAATVKTEELPYFIAVLSPGDDILQRKAFTTKISFDATGTGASAEEHTVIVPYPAGADAHGYKVVFGFALTPAQLKANEARK